MSESPRFVVLLDANTLAKPVTRTLLMIAGAGSGYGTTWSAHVEDEANRHLRPGQTSVTSVRVAAGQQLSEAGRDAERFSRTSAGDRQVLADAVAAHAMFIATEDVDDFDERDLALAGVAAVNPDLFMSVRLTTAGYTAAVTFLSGRSQNPHRTPEEYHRALGRVHPRTVLAHQAAFPQVVPAPATHNPAARLYRGNRCLICLELEDLRELGICAGCATGGTRAVAGTSYSG